MTEENYQHLCFCGCGENVKWNKQTKQWNKFIHRHYWRKRSRGPMSEETKNRIKSSNIESWKDLNLRKKRSKLMKVVMNTPKNIKINSDSKIKYFSKPENRKKYSTALSKPEVRRKLSESTTKLWKDPKYSKKVQMGLNLSPNKPETIILNLLNELFPNEWKYTGDFSFMINGKNPDFTNINGQKKLIEMFGDYWHKGEDPEDRKNIFREFGYKTLVIWEYELKNIDIVKSKILKFDLE